MDMHVFGVYISDMRADSLPVNVNSTNFHRAGAGWRITCAQTRRWDDLDLWVLVSGKAVVRTSRTEHTLEPGACLLMRGGDDYDLHVIEHPLDHYYAHFTYVGSDALPIDHRTLTLPPVFRRLGGSLRLVTDMFDRMKEAFSSRRPGHAHASNRWLEAILMEVASRDMPERQSPRSIPYRREMDEIREAVLTNPGGDHHVDTFASRLGLDPSYFCRLFRSHFGMPPRQFITQVRIDAACYMLRDTVMSVGQIASELGYHDVHFFSRHFKKQQGVSPTEYRRGPLVGGAIRMRQRA